MPSGEAVYQYAHPPSYDPLPWFGRCADNTAVEGGEPGGEWEGLFHVLFYGTRDSGSVEKRGTLHRFEGKEDRLYLAICPAKYI